ncbi:MAG: response regulator transcription factor [Solirubrobacterales bacterium]
MGKKILICDDSLMIRTQLRDFINKLEGGYEVIEAADGNAAVEMFTANTPDLVFLDVVMPGRGGLECLRLMKEANAATPVVMLSSVGAKHVLKEALEAGASDFVQKPWGEKLISSIIERFTGGA